jgi:hypothetical protein
MGVGISLMSRLSLRPHAQPATATEAVQRPRDRWLRQLPGLARKALVALIVAVVAAALFTAYLHLSRTDPNNSDGAAIALQAQNMLHGNLLLHGWILSDVSFYTTELPQYMLVEAVHGLGPDVMHIAAAMTYTLLVLLAAWLAKGRATGREGLLRAGLAAGIMAAPPLGSVYVLMLEPDHVGSSVPVLLLAVLLDRAGRRWFVPVLAGLLVAWGLVADQVILVTAVLPLILVALVHGYRRLVARRPGAARPWFEAGLLAAALVAVIIADRAAALIRRHGGYFVYPVNHQLAYVDTLPHNLLVTFQSLLVLFGANFAGHRAGLLSAIGLLHLVGVGLVGWALCAALRRFGRLAISMQLVTASVCVTTLAFVLGPNALTGQSSREIAAVLPLGAALAGRMLTARLRRARLMPALAVGLAVYLGGLVFYASRPPAPLVNRPLAGWLTSHRLDHGLTLDYWLANSTTVDSSDQVALRTIQLDGQRLSPNGWEVNLAWYSPHTQVANFVAMPRTGGWSGTWPHVEGAGALLHSFGPPHKAYVLPGYTVLVWNQNLLARLARLLSAQGSVRCAVG